MTNEDTAVAITLTGSDPDEDELSFSVVTNPMHGVLTGTAPNLTYTPAAHYMERIALPSKQTTERLTRTRQQFQLQSTR